MAGNRPPLTLNEPTYKRAALVHRPPLNEATCKSALGTRARPQAAPERGDLQTSPDLVHRPPLNEETYKRTLGTRPERTDLQTNPGHLELVLRPPLNEASCKRTLGTQSPTGRP